MEWLTSVPTRKCDWLTISCIYGQLLKPNHSQLWNTLDQKIRNGIAPRINGELNAPPWHLFDMAFTTTAKLVIADLLD